MPHREKHPTHKSHLITAEESRMKREKKAGKIEVAELLGLIQRVTELDEKIEWCESTKRYYQEQRQTLMKQLLKASKDTVPCPSCGSKKTNFKEYSVVLEGEGLECRSCRHLWKV